MIVYLIRHAKTIGNLEKRYVGSTDEPLCEEGIEELYKKIRRGAYHIMSLNDSIGEAESAALSQNFKQLLCVRKVYTSPMLRCRQTAERLFPDIRPIEIPDFREMHFGEFENKNYQEIKHHPAFQRFIDSGGTTRFPDGEPRKDFNERCKNAFLRILEGETEQSIVCIVHGGTIMSICSALEEKEDDYFCYQAGNGEGYICSYRNHKFQVLKAIGRR